jgi:hypothetical protein
MRGAILELPQYAFMTWCSVKKVQGQLYFTFTLPVSRLAVGHEADHSPPSTAEVKSEWSYASTPSYVFIAQCLVKHRMRLHGEVLS